MKKLKDLPGWPKKEKSNYTPLMPTCSTGYNDGYNQALDQLGDMEVVIDKEKAFELINNEEKLDFLCENTINFIINILSTADIII